MVALWAAKTFVISNLMKLEFDKEIDALLRRNTRTAERGSAREDEGSPSSSPTGAHLDADELNAFAENALPASARTLYVAHLADCDECRGAVAGLAGASNVSIKSEQKGAAHVKEARAESAWRGWLAALFAPRMMRYAVPVLALGLIGVVAFVALRSTQQGSQFVAQKDSEASNGRVSVTREAPAPAPGEGLIEGANQNSSAAETRESEAAPALGPRAATQTEGPVREKDALVSVPAQTGMGVGTGTGASAASPPPAPSIVFDGEERVGVVADAAPAPKAVSRDVREVAKSAEESQREAKAKTENNYTLDETRNQQANRAAQPRKVEIDQMPDGSLRGASRSESNNTGRGSNNLPSLSRQRAEDEAGRSSAKRSGRAAEPRSRRDEDATADDEQRAVSGHRFRRKDGAWVDVNYSTSMSITGVRRGTDGYRALVADVPELGRIAVQLQGEIIVVVKGRAYRIR
jgi:hypothetical protein